MKKALIILAGILLLLAVGVCAKLYLIGEPVDGTQLSYAISENGNSLHIGIATPASAIALRGWTYHQDGSTLYLSCRKVLVSPLFSDGTYQTTIPDLSLLEKIYLGGELIWEH